MMDEIRMKEVRGWFGRKKFVMDDTVYKPKTFHEEEAEKIDAFLVKWVKLSLIPTALVLAVYLWPHDIYWDGSGSKMADFGYPGAALFMGLGTLLVTNIPNLIITGVWSLSLWSVTGGR